MKTKVKPGATRRETLVRNVALNLGKNMSTVADELKPATTPSGLLSMLRTTRPTNETLGRLARWLRANGCVISINELL